MLNVIGDMQDYRVASHSVNNFEKVLFFFLSLLSSYLPCVVWSHLGKHDYTQCTSHAVSQQDVQCVLPLCLFDIRANMFHSQTGNSSTHTSCRTHSIPFSGTLGERCNAIFAALRSLCFGNDGTKQHGKIKHLVSLCRRDGWTYLGPRFAADKAAPSKPEQAGERLSTCPPAYVHHITVARAHAAAASV